MSGTTQLQVIVNAIVSWERREMALENLFLKKLALKVYRIDIESETIIETMINFYFHKTKDCNFRHDIFNFSDAIFN